ncbi:pentatricopeptide repeat-containing protein [Striga asiatica]|uniref:Pentatricopeptide repeat-containing protein n=1 Tax=Striga asiatica TaxID=4170 RepID=A0A5A7QZ15_STRAF|nr:pentatricopeptide repeat-containing protein [Striga asiatica]
MASTFQLKPLSFSLVVTGSSVSPPLSLRPVGLIRGEFFGGGCRTLRLPRRRWKKPRPRSQARYSMVFYNASLDSHPILVFAAAIATVSAVTVVFISYSIKQLNVKQMSGKLTLAVSEQIRSMMGWMLTDSHSQQRKKGSVYGSKDSMGETRETDHANNYVSDEFKFREKVATAGGAVVEVASQFQSDTVASSSHDYSTSQASETIEIPSLPSVLSNHGVQNVDEHPNSAASKVAVMETVVGKSLSPAAHIHEGTNQYGGRKIEFLEKDDTNIFNHIFNSSARKELHTIDKMCLEQLDNLEPVSYYATLQMKHSYSSRMYNSVGGGSNLAACNAILPIEKSEEDRPLGYHSQGFLFQQKDAIHRLELRKKDNKAIHCDTPKNSPPPSDPKDKLNHDKHNHSWQLRVYNQLLREGRLNDCIELLEDLEEKGLLDMDKVYHGRFFEVCKVKKDIRQAFRFTKFIPNPTLSTFNMLMSVCTSCQDSEGAFRVLQHVQEAGLKADCKLYTTLISTCAKSGKVDTMFRVFHEMVNAGVEPNLHTYGALIDGCGKAGQVAKAFGAYGLLRSKNVKPDRVIFNALITACGQSKAVDRAFDVLAEMSAEKHPIDPDHITIGALMKACAGVGQVDRAREVYNMIHKYNIRGNAELYTIAVNSCSDWEFACSVYDDMIKKGVAPDEKFISALIDVGGHAGKVDAAFEIVQEAKARGMNVGIISYSSLMGACSNARAWQKAVGLYEDIKRLNLKPTVSMMNALITSLCDADQLQKAMEILQEMKGYGLRPNTITYSILAVASEKKDDLEAGLALISETKKNGATPSLLMCRCLIVCFLKLCAQGDSKQLIHLVTQCCLSPMGEFRLIVNELGEYVVDAAIMRTSLALMVYRETILAGVVPTMDELSLVLGCLQLPHDVSVRNRLIENLGVNADKSKDANLFSLIDGFGEYDPRAFSIVEEAASLGVIPFVSFKDTPIVVDARNFQVHTAEVYLLTVLKGLKHRLAAGVKLPNVTILLPVEKTQIQTSSGEKIVNIAGSYSKDGCHFNKISQAVAALLRRLGLSYIGNESYGKIRINGVTIRTWFQPKLRSRFDANNMDFSSSVRHLGSGISRQQFEIRTDHFSLE